MLLSLQYLRAVAALLVVYFHAVLQVETGLGNPDTVLPAFGRSGVDLFFVISGYVMWSSTAGRSMSVLDFYKRRVVRILPLYWGITLFACGIAIAAPNLLRSTVFELDHAIASLLFIPWPNPAFPAGHPETLTPILIPGWTLNYEMFFYALFGLGLLARETVRPFVIATLILLHLFLGTVFGDVSWILAFYGNTMLLEFLAGMFIAQSMQRSFPSDWVAPTVLLFTCTVLIIWLDAVGLVADRAIQLGIPAAIIIFAAVSLDKQGSTPKIWWLKVLGDASYSIYLTHIFVIAGLRVLLDAAGVPVSGVGSEALFVLVAFACSAGVGVLVYKLYEQPSTAVAKNLLMRQA